MERSIRDKLMHALEEVMCEDGASEKFDDGTTLGALDLNGMDFLELMMRLRARGLVIAEKSHIDLVGDVGFGKSNGKLKARTVGEVLAWIEGMQCAGTA